jgi:flagellin
MIINTNVSAINAQRQLGRVQSALDSNMEKLSSGMRINRAGDDASGLAVSEKLRTQIRGLNQANKNVENGVSFIQTAEGYLQETQDILHRIRELSVQAANGIYTTEDRMQIQVEVSQLVDEVNRVASHAQFNGMNMLTGRFSETNEIGEAMRIQVGANTDQSEAIYIEEMTAQSLGLINEQTGEMVSLSNPDAANATLGTVDTAVRVLNQQRANLGAYQNRFEMASQGIQVAAENMQAAESRIRDTDYAETMVEHAKNSILNEAASSMLAQSFNMNRNAVLNLLQ